jgi:arylsulfatase A-like enzyme
MKNTFKLYALAIAKVLLSLLIIESSTNADTSSDLEAYLNQKPASELLAIQVGEKTIKINGKTNQPNEGLFLGWLPMDAKTGAIAASPSLIKVASDSDERLAIEVPRFVKREHGEYDLLTSRWQLYRLNGDVYHPVSFARYSDDIVCRSPDLPQAIPRSKKGLGGWSSKREKLKDELDELGIASVTVNVMISHLVSTTPKANHTPFTWQGKKYYANEQGLAQYDATFQEAAKRGIVVSAILLVVNPHKSPNADYKLLAHPECEEKAEYAMPNVGSADGLELYGAILNLMAERWSRTDGVHGRVHHWIMHNEVDVGRVWTNAGEMTDIEYMDLYVRSMRLMNLIVKQYDPHSRAFISLTHHWGEKGGKDYYGSKRILQLLTQYCRAEGDFSWGLAHHPYPQSLFNPRTWEDKQATFDFNTKKITPRNLEVLDAYMKQPELLYRGTVRPIHLSENGFNSKDYSAKTLEDQAAGMALAWKKISSLATIETWHYHNWIDNRNEGGLRIGLRKFPNDEDDPLGKKPIWHLYQALGTPNESSVADPYLKTINAQDWKSLLHQGPIATRPNVLIILTEDQGAHMGALGTTGLKTPNMDALAKSGTLFRNAFVAYPVCSASKAALYTSLHNHTNGILNNTLNLHKRADKLAPNELNHPLYRNNRIRHQIPTLVERLKEAGYYQGVTHKLHVAPNEKFPYDEFIVHNSRQSTIEFIVRAKQSQKPWHLFYNIPNSHRPFPNSDQVKIRVNPLEVKLPKFLPDTPIIRQDWAEYLAAIEESDRFVGEVMEVLRETEQLSNTIVVFLGDHGPCFVHGKMTLYDLGLRIPLVISGPGWTSNATHDGLVSELDIFPTLLDCLDLPPLATTHGFTMRRLLQKNAEPSPRKYAFAEISNHGSLPNDGIQERSVFDGQWHLIYREKVEKRWRQVQADTKDWKPWGNRSYDETLRVKDHFPEAYRILTELDPQSLDGEVPPLELYDLKSDPDEVYNLAKDPMHRDQVDRLLVALRNWVQETADPAVHP